MQKERVASVEVKVVGVEASVSEYLLVHSMFPEPLDYFQSNVASKHNRSLNHDEMEFYMKRVRCCRCSRSGDVV